MKLLEFVNKKYPHLLFKTVTRVVLPFIGIVITKAIFPVFSLANSVYIITALLVFILVPAGCFLFGWDMLLSYKMQELINGLKEET